jgi:iron complex outermembrane receptor protein
VGIIQDWKPMTFRVATFYYDIQDFINDNGITAPGTGLGSDALYNIPHVRLYGIETEASLRLGKRFRATASYTYQEVNADSTQYDANYTYYLPTLLPKHKAKLLGRYEAWKDGFLQLSGRIVGERQAQKGETLDAYMVFDAGIEQRFKLGSVDYSAGLYVSNLLGESYQEIAGYDMPRQVYGLRLSAKF